MKKESKIQLRDVIEDDIPIFFAHQLDDEANYMAAFVKKDPKDWNAFRQHWQKTMLNEDVIIKTIIAENEIVGYIAMYFIQLERNIGYWIDKKFWGKGIAAKALTKFKKIIHIRPIYARVAFDNFGSIKVLEKCGFKKSGEDKYFANARGQEIVEFIFKLAD